jgi:hypothetical protein
MTSELQCFQRVVRLLLNIAVVRRPGVGGEPSNGGITCVFPGAWATATGIGPWSPGVVFRGSASMQQNSPVEIAFDGEDGAVPQSIPVCFGLGGRFTGIHENYVI